MSDKRYLISFTIHKGYNLPKADTLGKIDGFVKIRYGDTKKETKVVDSDYNPKWNYTFVVHTDLNKEKALELELYDKDMMSTEHVANLSITLPDKPVYKMTAEWQLRSKFKPHDSKKPSTVTYSIGWIKDIDHLSAALTQCHSSARIADKKRAVIPVGKSLLGSECDNDQDLILCVEYEKAQVDIKLWETTKKYQDSKLFELAYSYGGIKYKCRKKTWITPNDVAGYKVYSELKLDDIPFHYDFSKLTLSVSNATVLKKFTGTTVYGRHGWNQAYNYEGAKKNVKDIYTNDKHKTITMLEDSGAFVVDFDSDNIDFMWGVYVEHAAKGIVADMIYTKQKNCRERVLRYFGKPKDVSKAKIGMNIQIDDIVADEPISASDFEITLYQRQSTNNFSIAQFLPLA